MSLSTTIKLNEKILSYVNEAAKQQGLSKAAYLKCLIQKGIEQERKEQALKQYSKGVMTITEAAKYADTDLWTFLNYLKEENENLNVDLSDWKLAKNL
jgi:predicted HTH domain antitoxin